MNADNTHTLLSGEVMLVEDNPSDLKLLSDILSKGGFHVRAASDGELALRSVRAKLPDLIVLDVKLPGISGVEVCRRLRANPATRDVPVIFVSALSATDLKVRAFEAGGTDFVTKPFEPSEILARINTQLKMHVLQRRLVLQSEELVEEIEERLRAERQIAQLAKFPSENPNPVLRVDQSGRVLYANESSRALLDSWGVAQGELLPAAWRERITRVLASSQVEDVEEACRDGLFSLTLSPISEMGYVSIYGLDITERTRAEEALRESEEKFRSISASAQDAIIMMNADGNISYWNKAAERIFGYTREHVIGKHLHSAGLIIPERFLEAHRKAWPRFQETGQGSAVGRTIEVVGMRRNGKEFPVEFSLSAVRLEGRWHGIGILRDITERKSAEAELRKLSAAVEQSPASIVITDTHGTIEYVNPMFTEVTGYTAEEAIGQNPRILQSGKWPKAAYRKLWDTILAGKIWTGEFENKKKNGELYWEAASICPIRDAEGSITHFLGVKQDITRRILEGQELQQARRQAEDAHAGTKQLLEAISSVLIGVDVDGHVTAWNGAAERILGIESENAVGRLLEDLKIEWDHTAIRNRISECLAKRLSVRVDEMRFKRADGTDGFLSLTLNPLSSDGGASVGFLLVAADITQKMILQSQLAQSQKLESIGQLVLQRYSFGHRHRTKSLNLNPRACNRRIMRLR